MNTKNPYPNRNLPVGALEYKVLDRQVPDIKAGLDYGEKEFIYDIPRILNGGNFVNLGCLFGGSAILLAKGLQDRKLKGFVHTIDLYGEAEQLARVQHNIEKYKVTDYIMVNKGSTKQWAEQFFKEKKQFNFVFVDACHTYEAVKEDFLLYSQLLNENGIIAFHDTNQEQIDKVLKEHLFNNSLWEQEYWINRIKAFRKREN